MRLPLFLLLCLGLLGGALAANWSKDDHEIFDLVSQLRSSEGKSANFYSFLNVTIGATDKEIARAYKRRSLELHPDKNPGVKDIEKRFARLGLVNNILKDGARRERYDFFYKNGVPVWRGTAYLYSRFRPSVFHVLLLLVAFTSGVHWLLLQMKYGKDKSRLEYFEAAARKAAGGGGLSTSSVNKEKGGVVGSVLAQVTGDETAAGSTTPTEAYGSYGEGSIQLKKSKKEDSPAPVAAKSSKAANRSKHSAAGSSAKEKEERRRKVKVPMIEGVPNGQMNEFTVVDGEVFWPTGEPLWTAATAPSYTSLWPVKAAQALYQIAQSYLSEFKSQVPVATGKKQKSPKTDSEIDAEGPTSATEDEFDLCADGRDATAEGEEAKKPRKKGLGKAAANKRRQLKK